LQEARPCRPVPAIIPMDGVLEVDEYDDADALFVCGGLTPAYAAALGPVAADVRAWMSSGRPYAGFSSGAAIAAKRAVVGGYRLGARVVCPADAGEDLEEVTVVEGLGLVDFAVDVHAAQWGTVGRMIAAVGSQRVTRGVAIDEDTALVVGDEELSVVGHGAVHVVRRTKGGIHVDVVAAREPLSLARLA
jgi:cyanophycinase